ncbi:MAG TPA: hypothetical protein VF252_08615 [Gemmatimonadales bacterium]
MIRLALVVLAGILPFMTPQPAFAQGPASSVLWQRPTPVPRSAVPASAIAVSQAPDHRWEGMAIGAGVGALAFGLLGAAICGQSDSNDDCFGMVLGVGLLGAFCGGVTGGLIGGAIPKGEAADSTDTSD